MALKELRENEEEGNAMKVIFKTLQIYLTNN